MVERWLTLYLLLSAYVTIADYDERAGKKAALELARYLLPHSPSCPVPVANEADYSNGQFVKCDVRVWEDQVSVFEAAVQRSPSKSCDIVVANAGVIGADDLFTLQGLVAE